MNRIHRRFNIDVSDGYWGGPNRVEFCWWQDGDNVIINIPKAKVAKTTQKLYIWTKIYIL